MFEGDLPDYIHVGRVLNLSNNQLSGLMNQVSFNSEGVDTFDISFNQFEGCYNGSLRRNLCGLPNEVISDGNQFDAAWEDFCYCQAGICETVETNTWRGEEGAWADPNNWSERHLPLKNEKVIIPFKSSLFADPSVVHVPKNVDIEIYSLEVEPGAQLIIPDRTRLTVLTETGFQSLPNCEE